MAKLLVIDDEEGVRNILKKLFEREGYDVKLSSDPIVGLKDLESFKPDCVLLDIKMPKMDGIDVLARIKDIDKELVVIMITGYGNIESAMESMKLGAYDYITKPFDLEFIKNLVDKSIRS